MRSIRSRGLLVALVASVTTVACVFVSSGGSSSRLHTLRDTTEQVIVPGYHDLARDAAALREALAGYCAAPDDPGLVGAREAFLVTSATWSRTYAWGFGPVVDERLEGEIAFWPIRTDTVESNLAAGATLDEAWVASLGSAGKGLPVIEYLLFADSVGSDARRCAYAAAAAAHLATTTARLADAWDGGYADAVIGAGGESAVYGSQLEAFSAILTQMISAVQRIKLLRLGGPLGITTEGTPQPDAVELPYAEASVAAMVATLEGLRALWTVPDGDGLDEWLTERDAALAARVRDELDAAIAAVGAVPEPLSEYVAGADHTAGDAALEAIRRLERTLATDVSGALAIAVMFTDNDGD